MYRGNNEEEEEKEQDSDDDLERTDLQEETAVGNKALYDVLAESITKLVAQRPDILPAQTFSKQDLISSTVFVDYDRIDVVEREDDDISNIVS